MPTVYLKRGRSMNSEEKIIATFLRLIETECYSKVSIAEVMREAHLTRTYFYQAFDSKCDLARKALFSIIEELLDPLAHAIAGGGIDHEQLLQALVFVHAHKARMRTLIFYQGPEFNFQGEIKRVVKATALRQIKAQPHRTVQNDDFFAEMFAASIVAMLDWFIHQPAVTPEQMSALVERSLTRGLFAVLAEPAASFS